jgi:hypothetical protein
MEHIQWRREESIGILDRIRPDSIRNRWIVIVEEWEERSAKNNKKGRLIHNNIKP